MPTTYRDETKVAERRVGGVLLPRVGAVLAAAVVAGLIFAMMEMVLVQAVMGQPWYGPLHMIAAIVLGPSVLPPPPTFDIGVASTAVAIHMALSINFYGFTALFPWFAEGRGWIGFVSHAVYGLVLALVYRGWTSASRWQMHPSIAG